MGRLATLLGWVTLSRYVTASGKLQKARRGQLQPSDFAPHPAHPEEQRMEHNAALWLERKPTRIRDCVDLYRHMILLNIVTGCAAWALILFSTFFFFQVLSRFLSDATQPQWFGWVIIVTMLINSIVSNLLTSGTTTISTAIGASMKAGMQGLVFRVTQRLKNPEDAGTVNTLISNDADRIFAMGQFVAWTVTSALMILVSMVLTCVLLGWPAVPGLVVIVLVMVSARLLGTLSGKIRFGVLPHTDRRIGLISELLQSIFFVKMYVYEHFFWSRICDERTKEVRKLQQAGVVQAATFLMVNAASYVPAAMSLIIFIGTGQLLSPSIAFTLLALYFGMWFPMIMFSNGLARAGQAAPVLVRLRNLLEKEQMKPRDDWIKEASRASVSLRDCTFRFEKPLLGDAESVPFEVRHVSFEAVAPAVVMLCGAVGSGKTTTLLGILGQVNRTAGESAVAGSISYAGQSPFILNATLRDNVLFGSAMEEERYAMCIKVACLERDLEQLSDGEFTVIGEKGVNLSGGQKQRVSVARALYSDAQLLILDDVLSALDSHVQREFFMGLLSYVRERNKLVIFANHHLQYSEHVDQIVVFRAESGWAQQVERGSFAELTSNRGLFASLIEDYQEQQEGHADVVKGEELPKDAMVSARGPPSAKRADQVSRGTTAFNLVQDETSAIGAISWRTWVYYFSSYGIGLLVVILAFLAFSALRVYFEFHVAAWVGRTTALSFAEWTGVMVAVTTGLLLLMFVASAGLQLGALRASKIIHNQVLRRVLDATMQFFWSTPIGRILNRLGRDVDQLDLLLPFALDQSISLLLQALGIFVAVAIVFPVALATFPALFVGFAILIYFLRAGMRQFRRLGGVVRSFVMTSLEVAIVGKSVISAMDVFPRFEQEFRARAEVEVNTEFHVWMLGNFVGLYFNMLVSCFTFFVALIAITGPRLGSGALGSLAVSYTVRLAAAFQWSVRQLIDAEAFATSAERLLEYTQVPMEPQKGLVEAPPGWPSQGRVTFENVCMRYRPDLEDAVKDVTFEIAPFTSLGIVGRTGSAKSSLLIALLRFVPLSSGTIRIDGVDISTIDLKTLRGQLAVIPQDPVLFRGSLRENLDPLGQRGSEDIKQMLRVVQLDDEKMNLDAPLVQLSHGEKNLVAVARALLRNAKVLVEDEATASVDTKTDVIVQRVMRKLHCTRAVIAHRLNSVIECDKVMLMNNGRVQEIDVPVRLLRSEGSMFAALVMATGDQSSRHLFSLASHAEVHEESEAEDASALAIMTDFDLLSTPF